MEKDKLVSLIRAVQQGEDSAATQLYEAFHQDLYYYILKTANDSELAEDLLQDTFMEIYQTIGQLNEPAAFVTWSRQIAYHRCTAYFRKRREILADEDEDGHSIFDTVQEDRAEFIPDEALDKEDLKQTIHEMIAQLPMEQRSALLMRYFDELSVKEIAEIQGVSEGTVKSRLNYGRKAIQQSVESYEKKNGIKLHCVGIVPLLLWLFREYAVANGISLTAGTASATYAAATTAATTAASSTAVAAAEGATLAAAEGAKVIAMEGVKTGAKVAGKFAIKKIIAGVAAAAIVTGGTIAGTQLLNKPEEPAEDLPMEWYGYGEVAGYDGRRFDMRVEQMDDTYICGYLTVSLLYEPTHETYFEGTGSVSGESVIYEINYEMPYVTWVETYPEMELEYNKETDQFIFDEWYVYEATLNRVSVDPSELITTDACWQGYGEDGLIVYDPKDRLFTLDIYELRTEEITGCLTVSNGEQKDHVSEFSGRGYSAGDVIYYEIQLEKPRSNTFYSVVSTVDCFWLTYDIEAEIFHTSWAEIYEFEIEKVDS